MASLRCIFSSAVLCSIAWFAASSAAQSAGAAARRWTPPLTFERNEGQMDPEIDFLGRTGQYTVAVGKDGLRFALPGPQGRSSVELSFRDGHADAPVGVTEAGFRTNSYVGRDVAMYREGIRNFNRIALRRVYPGVDMEFYASGDRLEHDFLVAAGADAGTIALTLRGGQTARLTAAGEVLIRAGEGELRLEKPVAYQVGPKGRHDEVAAAFLFGGLEGGARELRFRLGAYDHRRPLVIDPVIVYATFAAGAGGSTAGAIATDPAGDVYLAGTTQSTAFNPSPATAPVENCGVSSCPYAVFVADLAAGGDGSTLRWITYIGAESAGSSTTVAAAVANGSTVFVGGSTSDTALASGAASAAPNATGGYVGYISSLASATGALNTTALMYLDATANNSAVRALALDGANHLFAAGALGSTTAPAPQLIAPSAHALAVTPAVTAFTATPQPQPGNAFVAEFPVAGPLGDPTTSVATPSFFTYVQRNTLLNAIAVDGVGAIYVGGQTTGGFALTEGAGPATNVNGLNDAFELTFTPQSAAAPTIQSFTWIDGTGSDTVAGLALAGGGTSYLFGNTTSTNLPSTTGAVQGAAVDTVSNGFVALAGSGTSGVPPVALTYLGGSGTVDAVTGGAFANGNVYVTGQTNAPSATTVNPAATALGSVATTVASATAPFNTQALAFGMDATGTGTRGYLASLTGGLTAMNYVANVGGAAGGDVASAVVLDANGNAYVAGTLVHGSTPYTSYTAYQTVSPSTANPSAYVAEIAYAPAATGLTLTAATGSPSANPVGYAGVGNASNVSYTWTLTAPTATGAANLVVQIPAVAQLTYTTASVTDPGTANAPVACSIAAGGAYCVIPSVPQTGGLNDTLHVVLNATVPSSAAALYGAFSVVAMASSPASEYATSSQSDTISAPAVLAITPASTFPATTVFSTDTGASGPQTRATYAFTVANTGAGASANTSFTLTLPNHLQVIAPVSVTGTGLVGTPVCDLSAAATGCTAIDLPAGASLVYTLTGTYPDIAVGPTGATAAAPNFSATASGFLSTVNAGIAPNTTIERGVHLHVTGSLSAPPSPQTAFNLGDALSYTITVANAGPSASSGTDPLTVTLPSGFVPTAGSGGTALSCAAPYTVCTVPVPVLTAGASTIFAVTGSFPDTVLNQAVLAAAQARSFTAAVALPLVNSYDSGGPSTDYSSASSLSVQRTAVLTVTASSLTPPASVCAGHSAACVYMQNAGDSQDKVPYSFVVRNAGPNIAVNARVTITLPYVPANPAGTTHPFNPGALTQVVPAPGFGAGLTCAYTAGSNQIVCAGGNLPLTTTPGTSLAISGNGTIDSGAVPTTTAFVTTASSPGSVALAEDANGAPGPVTLATVELDRAAHLVTAKQVVPSGTAAALPVNLDENAPSVSAGLNDTVTVTVQVGDTPLNSAPAVVVTETLPAYFRLTQPPPASAGCTAGTPAAALPVNFTTGATPVAMSCAIGTVAAGNATPSAGGTAGVGTSPVSFSYGGKFLDNGTNADITGTLLAKVKQLTVTLPTATAATSVAVDPVSPSDATSGAPAIRVIRAAHLVLRKTRNATVAAAPANFIDATDPNLDEKTAGTVFGVNDEVEYDIAVGNAGVNTALGVQFTDTLPPFFTLLRTFLVAGAAVAPDTGANASPGAQLAAGSLVCYAGAGVGPTPLVLPFATGASAQQITCSYGSPTAPLGLGKGASRTGAPDNATAIELVYQGKYQDNAPGADNIGAGVSTFAVQSNGGDASATPSLSVDNGPLADSLSAAVPVYAIQRAAHLSVVGTPLQVKTDETALTGGGANGTAVIAQAEPSSAGATPVFNCLRYKVEIQNSGPNVARQPQLTLTAPSVLNLASSPTALTTTPASDAPLPSTCGYGSTIAPTITGAAILPTSERAGNTLVVDVDGYFKLDTLTPAAANSQTGFAVSYSGLADPGVKESAKNAPFTAIAGNPVTVVNTPFGANFFVQPFSATGSRPARLAFTSVATPGITTANVAATGPGMPVGSSPDPRNNGATIPLYRTGAAPSFYSLGTTAIPATGTNPTGLCLTNGTAALADGFAKPERVLLWTLDGLPAGTALNAVPHVSLPYLGDITTGVVPLGGGSYVEAGGPALPYTSFASFPAVQPQPAQVCGQVNGFAPAASPMTVAVLEPVNFAPLMTASTQQVAQPPGKGVSEVAFVFPQQAHDYNDNDPCYVAGSPSGTGTRGVCDDNLVLTSWFYGAENLIPSEGHVVGPLTPAATLAFLNPPTPYEVQAGATLFFLVADQLAVPLYNAKQDCDPGNAPGSYTPVGTVAPCPIATGGLAGTLPQEAVFGSAEIAELTPSVNGGSSGLIALPPAADATSATTPVRTGYQTATATITAGQTAGFQWSLGGVVPGAGGTYALSCFMVDSATQTTPVAFPVGVTCQIPASIAYPANHTAGSTADPAIYVATAGTANARNAPPTWKRGFGGVVAALLLPVLLWRRRSGRGLTGGALLGLLLLAGAVGVAGCGAGFNSATAPTAAAAGTYSFRASATGGGTILTTAPFQVKVVPGN